VNLGLLLEMASGALADRVGVQSGDARLTYAELADAARATAQRVVAEKADAVVYCGTNDVTFPIALFGAAFAGVPFVPLNYRLSVEQLQPLVEQHPGALVVAGDRRVPGADPARTVDRASLVEVPAEAPDVELPGFVDPEDVAVILYTSGTSGTPKAALLRHRHLTAYVIGTVEFAAAEEDQAALVTVPPYHVAGLANLLSNVYAGRRIIYLDAFEPAVWLDICRTQGVTQAMVVPTMLARIVSHLEDQPAALPSLRSLSYGGSRMPLPVLEKALELFEGVGFVNAYGLTETSSTIALLGPDDHAAARAGDQLARKRLGSVGKLLPGIEAEVRDEDGTVLPAGEFGLVFLRGEQVSGEYASGSVLDEHGWFPTKDRGMVDDEGFLYIEGRADDTIIRGGENIAPAEIEDKLHEHPAIAEVVVVGVPDEEWGQRIAAVIVTVPGAEITSDEVQDFARQHLRSSKTPELVVFRHELPHTPTGKVLRREVLKDLVG
jgi:acyl-CoA synthetase (AMP-forming)/AMP-acid ligase II